MNSRTFIPEININQITKDSDVFKESKFNDKHYMVIQFNQIPTEEERNDLKTKGIELKKYIPQMAYTAIVSTDVKTNDFRSPLFRAVFNFQTGDKTTPALLKGRIPPHAITANGSVDLTIITFETIKGLNINTKLAELDARIIDEQPAFQTFVIRVPVSNIKNIINLPFVQWVDFIPAPNKLENTLGRSLHRVNELNDGVRNLTGDSVNVGIWDGGEVGSHIDFLPAGRVTLEETSGASTHSTHCAGTITGRGNINPDGRGMAPNAELYSYDFYGNIQSEMTVGIPANNLIVSSHSYGAGGSCGLTGAGVAYSSTSRGTDLNLNNFPSHIHCHSAGNSQSNCSGGWSTITGAGKSAKNNILVAALSTSDVLASFSSCGPVHDGRIKPEISGFGTSVLSTYPNNTYASISGTSMSTPGVAGSATLLVQRYKQLNSNVLPPSSLIKNIILNTAEDLGNLGPDYRYGYGRINALEAARILETSRYEINTIANGITNNSIITVPAGASKLRVMLTWNDPAGTANASLALVNDLNLSVINGPTTTLPWRLDPNNPSALAFRGVDSVSNIEQITIDNPTAGNYTLSVNGFSVPTGPTQEYSLTWWVEAQGIEVIYPNGAEEFDPSINETIRWNNPGVTTNQTVQYSLNGGSSWTTLATVSASTRSYIWNLPANANTSNALVRITSSSFSDQSDAVFSILNTPTNFSGTSGSFCNAGEVDFTWNNVTNATHYDIYVLNTTTGYFDTLGTNITGTTYAATGLPSATSMWFYILSKNSTTAAVSKRSLAINVTTSGAGSASAPGTISGSNTICAPSLSETYSIPAFPGASSYTWTAPPGASITAGQGTTTITVSYTTSSLSGNISVTANDGSCTSLPASLSVTVNQATIPITTNDTICANNTANLSASGSGTLEWYTNPTGGSSIHTGSSYTTPTLSSTMTYYVNNVFVAPNQTMGKPDNTGGGAIFNSNRHLKFDAYVDMEIISVVVYAGAAGNRTIQLRDNNGTPLQTTTVNLVSGMQTVNLNFNVPAGTDYQLGVATTTASIDMYRNNAGLTYPYDLAGIGSITRSDATTNGGLSHYYFFYNWTVKGADCESAREPVTAFVDPTPPAPQAIITHPSCSGATGSISIISPIGAGLEYSINGTNYQSATTISALAGTYNLTARTATSGCTSPPTSVTLNASTTLCGPNITLGATSTTSSILVGDSSIINFRINNLGSSPTTDTIRVTIGKPTDGTLALNLPPGWNILTNNAAIVQIYTNNVIQPGFANSVIIPAVYTHNGIPSSALKSSILIANPGSGGETITNDNNSGIFIQIN